MTGFRFIFNDDDDEGFELVEEAEVIEEELDDDQDVESTQGNDDEVIWEETED
jgi:hypothetical protein